MALIDWLFNITNALILWRNLFFGCRYPSRESFMVKSTDTDLERRFFLEQISDYREKCIDSIVMLNHHRPKP